MSHTCDACGEEFRTLTRKRLHDCPEGAKYGTTDAPDEDIPVADMDHDDLIDLATERLLICDVCGGSSDTVADVDTDRDADRVSVAVEFNCSECGATNENTAVIE